MREVMLWDGVMKRFSALQRAENSSINDIEFVEYEQFQFQCSSASRKFLNAARQELDAEFLDEFQCSSASRKFLNRSVRAEDALLEAVSVLFSEPKIPQCRTRSRSTRAGQSFSALQRAENSSIENYSVSD